MIDVGEVREIAPVGRIHASVDIPGSKSITNRALICAALAKGESILENASDSGDTALMINGLNQLGILVRKGEERLIVEGTGGRLFGPKFPIPVGNAGTTLRFLLSLASLAQGTVTFEAHERMGERPIDDLMQALRTLGVDAEFHAAGPRYVIRGGKLLGGPVVLKGDKSSQFLSSLLMVSPYADRDVEIRVEGRQTSLPYVDMTLAVMHHFGIDVVNFGDEKFTVNAGGRYEATEYTVEPDASGASYFLAAAGIAGGEIMVRRLRAASLQGDAHFTNVLQRMGCKVVEGAEGVKIWCDGGLRGIDVDMNSMPDIVPTVAAVALFAEGETHIRNVAQLKYKESDRLTALVEELAKLGADIALRDDGLVIRPLRLHGARLDTYDDHRLVMSFSLIGLRVPGVSIENPGCVKKSFPTYWREFEKLYLRT